MSVYKGSQKLLK